MTHISEILREWINEKVPNYKSQDLYGGEFSTDIMRQGIWKNGAKIGAVRILKDAKEIIKFVEWYSTLDHTEHCDATEISCTCGVENAKQAIREWKEKHGSVKS